MTRREAKQFVASILHIREGAADELAVGSIGIYPEWKPNVEYKVGIRVRHDELLYKARQEHTSQDIYPPNIVSALWAVINESNEGTIDDPIPAVAGMEYHQDLYYIYNEVIYKCIRQDSAEGTILHYTPDQLIGIYFEVV